MQYFYMKQVTAFNVTSYNLILFFFKLKQLIKVFKTKQYLKKKFSANIKFNEGNNLILIEL